jgi:hypothetical protein
VDFSPAVPIPISNLDFPVLMAKYMGMLKIAWYQVLPAIFEGGFKMAK